jgi:hypothetical protein
MKLARQAGAAMAAAVLGLAALTGTGTALAAPAAPAAAPRGCPPNDSYAVSHVRPYFIVNDNPAVHVTAPGGVRLSLAVSEGREVKGEVSGSGHFTIDGVVAQADVTISLDVRYETKLSIKQHRSWTVPASWAHGWLAWGSHGYTFDWKRLRTDAGCKVEQLAQGSARLPAKPKFGFEHGRGIAPPETK